MSDTALVLRVTDSDGKSYGGFQWPLTIGAEVVAPDWNPVAKCGGGLHGWMYGAGNSTSADIHVDSKWMVVEVALADVVMLDGKVKFPRCVVKFVGDQKTATDYLVLHEPRATCVISATCVVGDHQCTSVGDYGTSTAGDYGTATAGDYGTATAGYYGTATAGDYGTATAGDYGTATAGYKGTATAGHMGAILIRYWDERARRHRIQIGYIAEGGLKPDTPYRLNHNNFEEVNRADQ